MPTCTALIQGLVNIRLGIHKRPYNIGCGLLNQPMLVRQVGRSQDVGEQGDLGAGLKTRARVLCKDAIRLPGK